MGVGAIASWPRSCAHHCCVPCTVLSTEAKGTLRQLYPAHLNLISHLTPLTLPLPLILTHVNSTFRYILLTVVQTLYSYFVEGDTVFVGKRKTLDKRVRLSPSPLLFLTKSLTTTPSTDSNRTPNNSLHHLFPSLPFLHLLPFLLSLIHHHLSTTIHPHPLLRPLHRRRQVPPRKGPGRCVEGVQCFL